ncbi:MAG: type IVa pilus secretin PilQ [Phormidesmis priestleyi Ana]|uniref:Type IVa pilus secretin PilQ n=1 Tax=Phormidesmis priestleyi Ana TaxID=1666911 RepID=A0A0P7ZVD9_9CYAN|nr:MAG: type IVa pilus secretin PilQ [Phormidesmis priestleyi Ana]
MKRRLNFKSLMVGGALAVLASPLAAESAYGATTVEGISLRETKKGLTLTLETSGDTPQLFSTSTGKTFQADIAHAQLQLPKGKSFTQQNPAPGIESIQLDALENNRVRLTVKGQDKAPIGDIKKAADRDSVVISLDASAGAKATPSKLPTSIQTTSIQTKGDEPQGALRFPSLRSVGPWQIAQQTEDAPEILIPNPEVIIDGEPVLAPRVNGAPPFLPRAVAPPVGDLSISDIDSRLDEIDLGTAERVPRLVLRDASAREVLSLLARAAGLNLAFTNATDGEEGATATPEDIRVSIDIENEPVQNVFNYVLQISGLEANRVGRTIFVGPRLPNSARNVLIRSIRLNQVDVASALSFLVAMGAETAVSSERTVTNVNATEVGEGADISETARTSTSTSSTDVENQRIDFEDSLPLLRGLQVVGDERTNALTLIGTPRQIEIASAQLVQLDLRRRQVAVNLRVIDVNLDSLDAFGTSFSFSAGDTSLVQTGGLGLVNFGAGAPASTSLNPGQVGRGLAPVFGSLPFNIASRFLSQLQAVVTNGQAKIVTDPTLVVQEGQTAAVDLTQEIVTNITIERESTDAGTVTTTSFEKGNAGLSLQVQIERIDDNGFVNLSVAPTISAPTATFQVGDVGTATLLAERQLSSGQIRVRDGQTLILSGIIQESDRTEVSKVPILGDIPILGALFRRTNRSSERRELIVLLTPQVLDDSDESVYGYSYTPGEDVQQLLEDRQIQR